MMTHSSAHDSRKRPSSQVTGKCGKARNGRSPLMLFEQPRAIYQGRTWLIEPGNGRPYRRKYATNMIRRASKWSLGRTVSAHTLRHSAATASIERAGKVQAVAEYLATRTPPQRCATTSSKCLLIRS